MNLNLTRNLKNQLIFIQLIHSQHKNMADPSRMDNSRSVLEGDESFTVKVQKQLTKYKKKLFLNILVCFIALLILVMERVFRETLDANEAFLLENTQKKLASAFNINRKYYDFYVLVGIIGDFKFYALIMTHLLISVYVSIDAIVGLKGLFVHCLSLYILTLLELVYQGPRPFWTSPNIQTFYCDNSFTNPSVLTFGFFFDGSYLLTLYLKKTNEIKLLERLNIGEAGEENYNKITFFLKILVGVGIILAHIILFLRYLIGLLFICDYIMGLIYFGICFTLVKYFDFQIDKMIKSSTVLKKKARKYIFSWIIFLLLAILLAYVIFLVSEKTMPVKWMKNYVSWVGELILNL